MPLGSGDKLGPYQIESFLGAGGMGEVYRARDTRLNRLVAIKVLPSHLSTNSELKQRLEREARAISSLQHANICVLHDVGHEVERGIDYLVFEYLEGETLLERLRKGPISLSELVKVGAQIADALDRAHGAGIVHRDLKPANVMLTKSGAKLLDFGLAKSITIAGASNSARLPAFTATATMSAASPGGSPITQQGMIVGTFNYMSPEQVQGQEADGRSDVFNFWCGSV